MIKFLVSSITETDLRVSPENLKQALVARWPDIQIDDVDRGNRSFTWTRSGLYGPFNGYLNRKQQVVVLEGDIRDCAEFAQWYRQFVGDKYELVLYDDDYLYSVPIAPNTSVHDLSSPWLYSH